MLKKFFSPASIAIVGASTKPEKIGGILIANLLAGGFKGQLYPVNPKYNQIKDLKCYHSIEEIKQTVDLAIIATPAPTVPAVLKTSAELKKPIKNFIIISAGFSETGPDGQKLEQQIKDLATHYHLNIIGPNCLGLINPHQHLNASFAPNNFSAGPIGLIAQSGAFAAALLELGREENLGFSSIATIGNKTVIDETDLLAYYATDNKTKIIGLYLENIKRGPAFLATLKKVSARKPVIIIKAGATKATQNAIISHTGAMAGDEEVAESLITDCGAICAHSIIEFIAYLKIFAHFPKPKNNSVLLITNAGGPGILAADLVAQSPLLNLYSLSAAEKLLLQNKIPAASSYGNPLDLRGDADHLRYEAAIKKISQFKQLGALLVIATVQAQTNAPKIWQTLNATKSSCPFPVIPVIMSRHLPSLPALANFEEPLYAVKALEKHFLWGRPTSINFNKYTPVKSRLTKNSAYLNKIKERHRPILLFSEAENIGQSYGLNILSAPRLSAVDQNQLAYPVVLKIDSDKILHKNKEGGLILNIKNSAELASAAKKLQTKFPKTDLVVQPQSEPGLEIILGLKKDNNFGPVIMLGLGGILTEIINTKIFFSPLGNAQYLKNKIAGSALGQLLAKQKINLDSVVKEILKLSALANENPSIKELDLNPIVFYPDKPPVVLDIKIILE